MSNDDDSATVSESDEQEPGIKAVHLKCLMCDQTIRINTNDMYNQCDDAYKTKFLENSLADLIITEFICHHIFHQKLEKAPATRRSNPRYNMVRTVNDVVTENSEKFSCGCEKFDKFVALHESDIACELNANSPQADCDLRSEHCGSMLHYLTTCAMTSVLHDNGLHLYEVLENKFETSKSNYSTLLESPSTLTDISQMRKTPRSQEASNQGASTSRYRAATNFLHLLQVRKNVLSIQI